MASPDVSRHDRTGEVLVWSNPLPARRKGGVWVSGEAALADWPSADELKDDWSIVFGVEAEALVAEAAANGVLSG